MKSLQLKSRTIERPDSTTIVDETAFHLIRNAREFRNVLVGVEPKDVVIWKKAVDMLTFMPQLYFIIKPKDGSPLVHGFKYIVSLELAQDPECADIRAAWSEATKGD
jgi:hypothetical protein